MPSAYAHITLVNKSKMIVDKNDRDSELISAISNAIDVDEASVISLATRLRYESCI